MDSSIFDPFNPETDSHAEMESLTYSIRIAKDFVILFAVGNSSDEINRRMDEAEARLSDKLIQRIEVQADTSNLLHYLQEVIASPRPDVVFIFGLDNWISSILPPRSIPALLNLNATRDFFPLTFSGPLIFWTSQYVINAIAEVAPDFFSVRSGIYLFTLKPEEREVLLQMLVSPNVTEIKGFSTIKRAIHIKQLQGLLSEYRTLSNAKRNPITEANILRALAILLATESRYDEAELLFREVLQIRRNVLPQNHPDIAQSINGLAVLLARKDYIEEAELLFQEALQIRRNVLPQNHPDIAQSLNNLATTLVKEKHFEKAELLLQEALQIRRSVVPINDLDTAESLNNLGLLLIRKDRLEEAELLLQETLQMRRKSLPQNHPDIAQSLSNLGALYYNQDRYREAELLIQDALRMRKSSLPQNHTDIAQSLDNLGTLYTHQFRYKEAEPLHEEALKIFRNALPQGHPETRHSLTKLLNTYRRLGRNADADQLLEELLRL